MQNAAFSSKNHNRFIADYIFIKDKSTFILPQLLLNYLPFVYRCYHKYPQNIIFLYNIQRHAILCTITTIHYHHIRQLCLTVKWHLLFTQKEGENHIANIQTKIFSTHVLYIILNDYSILCAEIDITIMLTLLFLFVFLFFCK